MMGKKTLSEEHKKRISEAIKAKWREFESTGRAEEIRKKIRNSKQGKRANPETEFKKGNVPWNKGLASEKQPPWKGGTRLYWWKQARKVMKVKNTGIHVHHIDGNVTNNRPENLMVLPKGEHSRLHRLQEISEGKSLFGR